jgi:hypothetical protein
MGVVLLLSWTQNVDLSMRYTMVEFFSGLGNVSAMFRKDPTHVVASYEKNDSRSMDFMSPAGLASLVQCYPSYMHGKYICDGFSIYGV